MKIDFYKVSTLPAVLEKDSLYFVKNGDYAESYLTDSTGVAKGIGNSVMISSIVADAMANWSGGASAVTIVADIAARDAATGSATENMLILVIDASADPTVTSGSALYAYDATNKTDYKLAEYESMDLIVQWAEIQGRPSSQPADIDGAVDKAHTHANKTVLDKITEGAGGELLFNGEGIKSEWTTNDW